MAIEKRVISYAVPSKNLFDKNNVNWLIIGDRWTALNLGGVVYRNTGYEVERSFIISIKSNTAYTISFNNNFSKSLGTFTSTPVLGSQATVFKLSNTNDTITITSGVNDTYLFVQLYASDDYDNGARSEDIIPNIMINEGSTAFPYEPYGSKIHKYIKRDHKPNSNYDPNLPASENNPVAIDLGRKVISYSPSDYVPITPTDTTKYPTRLEGYKLDILNGTESLGTSTNECWNIVGSKSTSSPDSPYVYCNYLYPSIVAESTGTDRHGKVITSVYGTALGLRYEGEGGFTSQSDMKAHLKEKYDNSVPYMLLYYPSDEVVQSVWKSVKKFSTNQLGYYNEDTNEFMEAYGMTTN